MTPVLQAHLLNKTFLAKGKTIQALDSISLSIQKGTIFGLIGLSGAGKSTLLKALSTLDTSFSGSLFFEGTLVDVNNLKQLRQIRSHMGMIFQHFLLLDSKTVLDNIALSLELAPSPPACLEHRALELLQLVGLSSKKDCYPAELSGGEKQRVGIARALATHPKILFCDEATSALDPKTTQEILSLLYSLNQTLGLTILLITHEMDVVRAICKEAAVLDQGKILEQGPVVDLFHSPKHPLTEQLIQNTPHELDIHRLKSLHPDCLLLQLHFKGALAEKPLLSHLISHLFVEVNILSGWIDTVQSSQIGTLTVSLKATPLQEKQVFSFLQQNGVLYKVL